MTDAPSGHGSPAGELLPSDQPATTNGPTRDAIARWQTAAPGRAATKPAPTLHTDAQGAAGPRPTGVGPSSRDTPPPTGEAAVAAGTQASGEPPAQARAADRAMRPTPGDARPPRPTANAAAADAAVHLREKAGSAAPPPSGAGEAGDADQDALIDAIARRLAENLAKALRQSIVEAVQGAGAAPRPPDASDVPAGQAAQARVASEPAPAASPPARRP